MSTIASRPNRNISLEQSTGRWKVKVVRDGAEHYVGRFDSLEDARAARDKFEADYNAPSAELARQIKTQWHAHLNTPRRIAAQARLTQMDNAALHALLNQFPEALVHAALDLN